MSQGEHGDSFEGDNEKLVGTVLPLLQEYTERLRKEYEGYLKLDVWRLLSVVGVICSVFVVISAAVRTYRGTADAAQLNDAVWAVIVIFSVIVNAFEFTRRQQMRDFRRHDVRTTAARLEKIVRMGSQLEDQGVRDLGARVQLQLRLADAEATLDLVKTVLAPAFKVGSVQLAPPIATSPDQLRERHP